MDKEKIKDQKVVMWRVFDGMVRLMGEYDREIPHHFGRNMSKWIDRLGDSLSNMNEELDDYEIGYDK